jgi:hypothetical protein
MGSTAGKIRPMPQFDPATPLVLPLPGPDRAELRPGLGYASADDRELAGEADPALLRGVRCGSAAPPPATAAAEAAGVPVELALPGAHHAFDLLDDTDASRDAIRRVLSFLRQHLLA